MTINEGLALIKLLKQRHGELTSLREINRSEKSYLRSERDVVEKPMYDVKKVDAKAMEVAKEIRKLDSAIKKVNAVTEIEYTFHEVVLSGIE